MTPHNIYALCDPDTGDVRYIGRTSQPIEARLRNHIAQTVTDSKHGGRLITQWIIDLEKLGKKPKAVQLDECPIERIEEAERQWIALYIGKGNDLLNVHGRPAHAKVKLPRKTRTPKKPGRLTPGNVRMIGVPVALHARLKAEAQSQHLTIYELIEVLADKAARFDVAQAVFKEADEAQP